MRFVELALPARTTKTASFVEIERLWCQDANCKIYRLLLGRAGVSPHDNGARSIVDVRAGTCHRH